MTSDTARQGGLAPKLPVNPHETAKLLSHERAALYAELGLDVLQRAAAEEAVRALIAGRYRGAAA